MKQNESNSKSLLQLVAGWDKADRRVNVLSRKRDEITRELAQAEQERTELRTQIDARMGIGHYDGGASRGLSFEGQRPAARARAEGVKARAAERGKGKAKQTPQAPARAAAGGGKERSARPVRYGVDQVDSAIVNAIASLGGEGRAADIRGIVEKELPGLRPPVVRQRLGVLAAAKHHMEFRVDDARGRAHREVRIELVESTHSPRGSLYRMHEREVAEPEETGHEGEDTEHDHDRRNGAAVRDEDENGAGAHGA
jgi:hypothetical protein